MWRRKQIRRFKKPERIERAWTNPKMSTPRHITIQFSKVTDKSFKAARKKGLATHK